MQNIALVGPGMDNGVAICSLITEINDHIYLQRQGEFLPLYEGMLYAFTCCVGPGIVIGKDNFNDTEY